MPLFSRFKSKGAQPSSKGRSQGGLANGHAAPPVKPRWQSDWNSKVIEPDEVEELIHTCTAEMKSRAEALDSPFLLLPFRPHTDPQGARTFIRNFYKANAERSPKYTGAALQQELRLTEPIVLCSIMKWCWSRLPNGVVGWPVYEGFRMGEKESKMARNAFNTFIPISAESEAHKNIIFDFFDLIAAVAAHGKMNGLTGRKLSRLAGWWAFEHLDAGNGFEGGYKSWTAAADATSHLFFAYLRSLSPDTDPSMNVIERIPRSLQALLASTEYPPETPTLMQRSTPRVLMLVDTVSPTPFALLRRAKNFEYRDKDEVLREYAEFEDPLDALTDECRRVLYAISTTNQSTSARSRSGTVAKPDESWSAFQSMGFSEIDEKALAPRQPKVAASAIRSEPQSRSNDHARPTTPSWADFLSSGFADDGSTTKTSTLLLPPAQVLPPLRSPQQPQMYHHKSSSEENLAPGELAAITNVELDDAFWWVWMTSLASEETPDRKAVFGRCALIETNIKSGRWLIMEEQVKGATPDPTAGAYIAPKKGLFSFTKRLGRKRSTTKQTLRDEQPPRILSATPSRTSLAPDQHARIKAAAAAMTKKSTPDFDPSARRGKGDEGAANKTNNTVAIGLQSEAVPAMKFINAYDKNAIRAQYLGDSQAGTGKPRTSSVSNLSAEPSPAATAEAPPIPVQMRDFASISKPPAGPAVQPEVSATPSEPASVPVEPSAAPAAPIKPVTPTAAPVEAYQPRGSPPAAVEEPVLQPISPVSTVSSRKPVPSAQEQSRPPVTPKETSAVLAAARAMQKSSPASSPEYERNLNSKKSTTGNGGLKKFFSKRKDAGSASRGDSLDLIRPTATAPGTTNQSINRRLSLMRRKEQTPSRDSNEPSFSEPIATDSVVDESATVPTYVPTRGASNDFEHDISRVTTREQEDAEREFSRFDQGGVHETPTASPIEPIQTQQKFNTLAARRLVPEVSVPSDYHTAAPASHDPVTSDRDSEMTMEDRRDPPAVHDRWATIRENAAKRAQRADERQSEEQSTTQSRFSQSMRTDDGDTSGEETIESRVARIKARVAELTGNMDSAIRG